MATSRLWTFDFFSTCPYRIGEELPTQNSTPHHPCRIPLPLTLPAEYSDFRTPTSEFQIPSILLQILNIQIDPHALLKLSITQTAYGCLSDWG